MLVFVIPSVVTFIIKIVTMMYLFVLKKKYYLKIFLALTHNLFIVLSLRNNHFIDTNLNFHNLFLLLVNNFIYTY